MKTFCYELFATLNTYYVRSQSVCVHQDVSYDIMTDERFAIAIWFALFARVVHLFLRYSTSFILSWIAITLALRIFMYLTMHHCTSANVLTAAALFFHGDLKSCTTTCKVHFHV